MLILAVNHQNTSEYFDAENWNSKLFGTVLAYRRWQNSLRDQHKGDVLKCEI